MAEKTPCFVLFETMKKRGGISYKELASIILSGKPLSDGRSPVSRIDDRSWVSRFIVHAPAGTLHDGYFADYSISALRLISRLKSKRGRSLSGEQIFDMIAVDRRDAMEEALAAHHQDALLYRNVLERLRQNEGFSHDERAEIAMVLFLTAACTSDVRRAADAAMDFTKSFHGAGVATPLVTPRITKRLEDEGASPMAANITIGLLRVKDGYVVGAPHWVTAPSGEMIVGTMASEDNAMTDVESDVSTRHARIWKDDEGRWLIEGLGSSNGTTVLRGSDREVVVVEPPKEGRDEGWASGPIELIPGDEVTFASDSTFVVIEGVPQ